MYIEQTSKNEFALHGTSKDLANIYKGLILAFNQEKDNTQIKEQMSRQIIAFKPLTHKIGL
jgi:hypothetical protein